MRIFFAGDWYSGTGPANVTKYYIDNLPEGTLYQKKRSKLARIPEIIINTIRSDVVVYSGYSRQNILGLKLAKRFHKPCVYLMHGCVEYENEINLEPDKEMCEVERATIELADLVLAVSKSFESWLKEFYPNAKEKISHISNAIDNELAHKALSYHRKEEIRDKHMIFSIGGGMPRKMIKYVCKAVEILRRDYDSNLRLVVVGALGADTEEINSYSFVDNRGLVESKEVEKILRKASLFIQNSCFETFGLAPVEAVSQGCSVLMSKEVGAIEIFGKLSEDDIIEHYDQPQEIADKIRKNLECPNINRLSAGIDWESNTWMKRSEELVQILQQMVCSK